MQKHNFIKWLFYISFVCIIHVLLYKYGLLQHIIASDSTRLCLIIQLCFILFSLFLGIKTYKLVSLHSRTQSIDKDIDVYNEEQKISLIYKFMAYVLPSLGLIGTVFGMSSALYSFTQTDLLIDTKQMIQSLSNGMYSALYTTGYGAIYGLLLYVQKLNLDLIND